VDILKRLITALFLTTLFLQAATRSDINAIEAAEKIRYLSQKIAKDYLYLYSRPQRTDIKHNLEQMVERLGKSFATIAASTRDSDTKDLLEYLRYSQKGMRELLQKPVTKQTAAKMLDYSQILLEGAEWIVNTHSYRFSKEEAMLMNIKRYEYLLVRLGKLYMASRVEDLSQSNQQQIKDELASLQKGLDTIQAYRYPASLESLKKDLNLFRDANRHFLTHANEMFVPGVLDITIGQFEQILNQFALFHSKSQ